MKTDNIISQTDALIELVQRWQSVKAIPTIEKDMALGILQDIYRQVLALPQQAIVAYTTHNNESDDESTLLSNNDNNEQLAVVEPLDQVKETEIVAIAKEVMDEIAELAQQIDQTIHIQEIPTYSQQENPQQEVHELTGMEIEDSENATENVAPENDIDNITSASESKLESQPETEVISKPESESQPESEVTPESESQPETEVTPEPESEPKHTNSNPSNEVNTPRHYGSAADMLMVEMFGQMIPASKKKEFITHLFNDDKYHFFYEAAKIGNMSSLDQVLIYIGEKYNWSAQDALAEEFIELLVNKYEA